MTRKPYGRSVVMGILAGTLYGLWAVHANRGHDVAHVARAASAQFLLSSCATALLTLLIEVILARGRTIPNLVFAATGPHAGMVTLFLAVHLLSGTPHVLATIAPSAAIGLVFSMVYVRKRAACDSPCASA